MRTPIQIALVLTLVGGASFIAKWLIDNRPVAVMDVPPARHPLVRVLEVSAGPFELTVHGRGEVDPREVVALVSEVEGRVQALSPSLVTGGSFTAGEILVELDPADLMGVRARAEARHEEARTILERELAEAGVARDHLASLGLDGATDLALRKPQVTQARAQVKAAAAELDRSERDVERARLRAPFDGRVRGEGVGLGQLVSRGQVLGELFSTDLAEVRVPVRDDDLASLDLDVYGVLEDGPGAWLETEFAGATRRWRGKVLRIEGDVDRASRMPTLVVGVQDPFGAAAEQAGVPLMPGLFVDVTITGRVEPGVVLPRSAMRAGSRVYVIDEDDRLRFREVTVSWRGPSRVLVSAGLAGGERVCISPLAAPVDGERVEVLLEGPAPLEGR